MLAEASIRATAAINQNSAAGVKVAVGVDSVTVASGMCQAGYNQDATSLIFMAIGASYRGYPGLGYHYLAWLERGSDVNCTFLGDDGGSHTVQSGLQATILG